jgi:hypothetical protein
MENGSVWHWEVVTADQEVIARGVAATRAAAHEQADDAASAFDEGVEPRIDGPHSASASH